MIRNHYRSGRYLVMDELSGEVLYDDQVITRYDGLIMRKSGNEDEVPRHPQEFVRARKERQVDGPISPQEASTARDAALDGVDPVLALRLPTGAAQHLYPVYGIETPDNGMEIPADGITLASARVCARLFVVT